MKRLPRLFQKDYLLIFKLFSCIIIAKHMIIILLKQPTSLHFQTFGGRRKIVFNILRCIVAIYSSFDYVRQQVPFTEKNTFNIIYPSSTMYYGRDCDFLFPPNLTIGSETEKLNYSFISP